MGARSAINSLCCVATLFAGFVAATAGAAEIEIHPSITVSEEFNDNIFDTPADRRSDFITRVLPGFSLRYLAPFWDWDTSYTFEYRNYAWGARGDEITHTVAARGIVRLIDEFMLMDVSDTYRRVSLDVARDATLESPFVNQSDRNTFSASPYLLWRPTTNSTLRTGYRYVTTWYREPSGVDRTDHGAFAEGAYEFTDKLSLTATYAFTREDTAVSVFDKHDSYAGFRYEYADRSFISAQGGNSWISYDTGRNLSNPFWNAAITHAFDGVTINLSAGITYTEDPLGDIVKETSYTGRIAKQIERGELALFSAYTEFDRTGAGTPLPKRLTVGGTGRYEFTERLSATIDLAGEKYERVSAGELPYRFIGGTGFSYTLGEGFTVAVTYRHISNFRNLDADSPEFGSQVNRGVVELRKTF